MRGGGEGVSQKDWEKRKEETIDDLKYAIHIHISINYIDPTMAALLICLIGKVNWMVAYDWIRIVFTNARTR